MKTKTAEPTPQPWELNIHRYPNGKLSGAPYIYAPNGPDGHRHICQPFLDEGAPQEIQDEQEANARLLAAAPDLLEACKSLVAHMWEGRPKRNVRRDAYLMIAEVAAQNAIRKAEAA